MYVLDTNTVIHFFRGQGNVAKRLLGVAPVDVAVPTLVLFELETGIAKSRTPAKHRTQLDALLRMVSVIPFGDVEARAAGQLRARLEAAGKPIGPIDTLIAGVAIANRAVLVTHDVSEFGRVDGLLVEDWYA